MITAELVKELANIKRELAGIKREQAETRRHLIGEDTWLSPKEAAELLGMSEDNLRKHRYSGRIPVHAYRVRNTGRGYQYRKASLEKLFTKTK